MLGYSQVKDLKACIFFQNQWSLPILAIQISKWFLFSSVEAVLEFGVSLSKF